MSVLLDINTENWPVYQDRILEIESLSYSSPWSPNAFLEEIRNPVSRLSAIVITGNLAGYICFWMLDREIQLMNIAVHPDRRHEGIGYFLLSNMIEVGLSRGICSVWLEVRPSNVVAKKLYYKFGFEERGRRPLYYRDTNEDAIVMSLALSVEKRAMSS